MCHALRCTTLSLAARLICRRKPRLYLSAELRCDTRRHVFLLFCEIIDVIEDVTHQFIDGERRPQLIEHLAYGALSEPTLRPHLVIIRHAVEPIVTARGLEEILTLHDSALISHVEEVRGALVELFNLLGLYSV